MRNLIKYIYGVIPFKKQIFLLLRKLKLSHNIYQHLHFVGPFWVKTPSSKFQIQHDGNRIENEIFWKGLLGGWEKESLRLWIELVSISDTILDVGANTGIYSLIAKSISPNSKVIAFEPIDNIYRKLLHNININSFKIEPHNFALSDYNGEGIIYVPKGEHSYSASLEKNFIEGAKPKKVKTKTLDKIISDKKLKIDLLKIDVESHELKVIEGMGAVLKQSKPTILIEILTSENAKSIGKYLEGFNYLYFNIGEQKITKIEELEESSDFNILICQEDIAKSINLI